MASFEDEAFDEDYSLDIVDGLQPSSSEVQPNASLYSHHHHHHHHHQQVTFSTSLLLGEPAEDSSSSPHTTPPRLNTRVHGLNSLIHRLSRQNLQLEASSNHGVSTAASGHIPSSPTDTSMGSPDLGPVEAELPPRSSMQPLPPTTAEDDEGVSMSAMDEEDDLFPASTIPPIHHSADPGPTTRPRPYQDAPVCVDRRRIESLMADMVANAEQCIVYPSPLTPTPTQTPTTTTAPPPTPAPPTTIQANPTSTSSSSTPVPPPLPPPLLLSNPPPAPPPTTTTQALLPKPLEWDDSPIEADPDLDEEEEEWAETARKNAMITWTTASGVRKRGTIKYAASAEVAMRCPNVVLSRPRMRKRMVRSSASKPSHHSKHQQQQQQQQQLAPPSSVPGEGPL